MAGYSSTPLIQKLGLKANESLYVHDMPIGWIESLGTLPSGLNVVQKLNCTVERMVLFLKSQADLRRVFAEVLPHLPADGSIWIAWPKKASKVPTDLNENLIRDLGLSLELVDNKVCAIDETWSGLRFVVRLKDRDSWRERVSG